MIGGAEVAIKEITDRISDVDFHMVTLRYDSSLPRLEKIGNIIVHRIGFSKKDPKPDSLLSFPMYFNKVFFPVLAPLYAYFIDREEKFDGIWSMMIFMSLPAMIFNFFFRKIPYGISIQEGDDIDSFMKKWFMRPFKFLVLRSLYQASTVQAISCFLSDWIRSLGYVGKLVVVPNGVNLALFNENFSNVLDIRNLRKEVGFQDDDFVISTTSRLVYKNGIDVLVSALSLLSDKFKLLVVGDGPLKEDILKQIRNLKLTNRVFMFGQKDQKEIPKYLLLSDVFCRPSRTEGQGIAFLEAMALGVPVLATRVGGIVDFLKDGETGLFFEKDNSEDLALKLNLISEDKILKNKLVDKAKKLVSEHYDWDDLVLKMKSDFFNSFF